MKPAEETTAEPVVPVVAAPAEEVKVDETAAPATAEKPKPQKRGSIFGSFVEKLKSPTTEKKEHEAGLASTPVKENETAAEAKPLEEATVGAPVVAEPVVAATEPAKTEEAKVSTPSKEKDHFKFGKFFGSKDRAKSPAREPKVDAAAPQIADTNAPATVEPVQAVEPAPIAETKVEPTAETEAPKQDKRKSFFGNLGRSLSKATGNKAPKDKKDAASPAPVAEEEAVAAPAVEEKKEETTAPVVADIPAENSVGDASKSANPTVATTA